VSHIIQTPDDYLFAILFRSLLYSYYCYESYFLAVGCNCSMGWWSGWLSCREIVV